MGCLTTIGGIQRHATNTIDGQGALLTGIYTGDPYSSNLVVTDFDGAGAANRWGSTNPTSLEGTVAGNQIGDAGGPWLLNDKIAAITSFGGSNNFIYRDVAVATAVTPHNTWINSTMGGVNWNARIITGTIPFHDATAWGDGIVPATTSDVRFSLPTVSAFLFGAPYIRIDENAAVRDMTVEFGVHEFNMLSSKALTVNGSLHVDSDGVVLLDGRLDSLGFGSAYQIGIEGNGRVVQEGGLTQVLNGSVEIGVTSTSNGTYVLEDGILLTNSTVYVGYGGEGTFSQEDGDVDSVGIVIGRNLGSRGIYTLDIGTLDTGLDLHVGFEGTGDVVQNGGSVFVGRELGIGRETSGVGSYELNTGDLTVIGATFIGRSGNGLFHQAGGTLNANGTVIGRNSTINSGGRYVMDGGVFNESFALLVGVGANGQFEQSGGIVNAKRVEIASDATSTSQYDLSGGNLITESIAFGDGDGQFNFTGGTLSVDTFNGDLVNQGGILSPGNSAGTTTVLGSYTQESGGQLEIEIGGLLSGTEFDFVNITGLADLAGDLMFSLIDGFLPDTVDLFTIFDADSLLGDLGNVLSGERLDTVDGSGSFLVNYGSTSTFDPTQIVLSNFLLAGGGNFAGDFDSDGDVDGADFLAWQRGESTTPLSINDLVNWQTNYGSGSNALAANHAVPEPSALAILSTLVVAACFLRRNSRILTQIP